MQIADLLIERAKLIKRQTLLKLALVASLCLVGYVSYNKKQPKDDVAVNPIGYIALIRIDNEIFEDKKFDKLLNDIQKNNSAKALIVQINSPGGSSGASEKIYTKLLEIKKTKPVVVAMEDVAASGGYIVALAAEKIYALNMTVTGSIGVIMQSGDIIDLGKKLGINFKNYKSSELKASPNPFEVATPEAEQAIMDVIEDSYDYFVDIVALNRKISKAEAKKLADGRVYTGRQAMQLKLVDEIGTVDDAVKWLKDEKGLDQSIQTKLLEPKKRSEFYDIIMDSFDDTSKSLASKFSIKLMSIYK